MPFPSFRESDLKWKFPQKKLQICNMYLTLYWSCVLRHRSTAPWDNSMNVTDCKWKRRGNPKCRQSSLTFHLVGCRNGDRIVTCTLYTISIGLFVWMWLVAACLIVSKNLSRDEKDVAKQRCAADLKFHSVFLKSATIKVGQRWVVWHKYPPDVG